MKKTSGFVTVLLLITLALLGLLEDDVVDNKVLEDLDGKLSVTFLDVGQGDATFVEFPNGSQMLVDCAIDARILEALGRVMPYHDKTIDYLLITHPDKDHYGGCVDVFDRFDVGHVIYNGYRKEDSVFWWAFWDSLEAEGAEYTEVVEVMDWVIASTTMRFLYPDHSLAEDPQIPGDDVTTVAANNGSIVFSLSYGDVDLLMTGDAEKKLEEYLVDLYSGSLDVEVLKVGHHGSNTSSIAPFLEATTPEYSIVSAGEGNRYGHPTPRVLKRIERASSTIFRTDVHGDITMTTDGNEFWFKELE